MESLKLQELDRCVHCGLCLNQCPTYRAVRLETESPRGRIHLVRAAAEDRIELNDRFKDHIYLCLLCRACETACPSGVEYGHIAEAARRELGPPGSKAMRTVLGFVFKRVLPYPNRLKAFALCLRLYQKSGLQRVLAPLLPKHLRRMDAMLPPVPAHFFNPRSQSYRPVGQRRARVGVLNGCVMPLLLPEVNESTIRVLQHSGCEVHVPKGQTCCGALNIHNGESDAAKAMARRNIDVFLSPSFDAVIVNAAGCGAVMKEYDHLLREDPLYADKARRFSSLVRDVSEFLADVGLHGNLGPIRKTITYQDPCHLAHGQRIRSQPRKLLAAIPGLKVVELPGSDRCCGSAGIYNITHPGMSGFLLEEKMKAIAGTAAEAVVAPNPGCMLQLRQGSRQFGPKVEVFHLIDLLDQAYREAEKSSPI